jgi:hypothetical protein
MGLQEESNLVVWQSQVDMHQAILHGGLQRRELAWRQAVSMQLSGEAGSAPMYLIPLTRPCSSDPLAYRTPTWTT